MSRSPLRAFLLSIIPGFGHYYVGRRILSVLYGLCFFGLAGLDVLLLFIAAMSNRGGDDAFLVFFFICFLVWIINIVDMLIFLMTHPVGRWPVDRLRPVPHHNMAHQDEQFGSGLEGAGAGSIDYKLNQDTNERFKTILLSFIPGLGHFQLGLMHRGAAFLLSFFGLFTMVTFLSVAVFGERFMVFILALPVIWFYNMFDVANLLKRKQQGEQLEDRTIFEEFEASRRDGRKSKTMATVLSVFPGAGHMYLGQQRRGLQLMAAFLLSIYMLDVLRLSLFLFLIPIIWFYGFFDALQQVTKQGQEEPQDVPLVDWLMNHQRWIGFGLLGLGAYYLFDQLVLGILQDYFPRVRISYWFHRYFQTFVVGTLLIGGGIRLLAGGKRRNQP
jgi:hypothetical protein